MLAIMISFPIILLTYQDIFHKDFFFFNNLYQLRDDDNTKYSEMFSNQWVIRFLL